MLRNINPQTLKGSIIIFVLGYSCNQMAQTPVFSPPGSSGFIKNSPEKAGKRYSQGHQESPEPNPFPSVGSIPLPPGYSRVEVENNCFGLWLRTVSLKNSKTVYLFDGSPKSNQDAQFAVLNVSVGQTDLQQCADAVMRLRAEFLFARKDYKDIDFTTAQGIHLNFLHWTEGERFKLKDGRLISYKIIPKEQSSSGYLNFTTFLQTAFSYCGTLSLEKQLLPVTPFSKIKIGDVLIKGGSPGHAMLVMDMAEDQKGRKIYLLAQSYMPAQDIHIVINKYNKQLSPWYEVTDSQLIYTPEWTFYPNQLRAWPDPDPGKQNK